MTRLICFLCMLPLLAFGQEVKRHEAPKREFHQHMRGERGNRVEGRHRFGGREFYRHHPQWRPERHDRDFYVHRYGDRMRAINGGWYFYSDGCWIAAVGYDPDYDSYSEYEICPGDDAYISVEW